MRRLIFPLAISLCVLAHHSPVAAKDKDTWISVRTNNFFVVGNAPEKEIKQVGLKLEQFREVFTRLFPNIRLKTPVPTTVMVFKNDSSYAPFKIRSNSSGHFQSGPDVNYIALTTDTKFEDHLSVIFHEFTHLLVRNTFINAPVWFNEGLAEYYSTFRINDDRMVVLGFPIANHVILLRKNKLLPLRTLFEVDHKSPHYNEAEKTSIFYAQSWALMHYLMIGKAGRNEQLEKFMKLLNSRVPLERAFQDAFGMTFEAMETELTNYVNGDRYNISLDRFASKLELNITTEAKKLSDAEALAYQGDLLLHSDRRKEAYFYLEQAVKLDPNLAMAHASLGMAYFGEARISEAQASLARAVAANSQNYLAHYNYAFVLSRADTITGLTIVNYSPEQAEKIREHLQKAIALRPDFPESYNLLAYVSLVTGKDVDEAIVLLKRVLSEMPGQHNLSYMLAQLYVHRDEYKSARDLVDEILKSSADEEVRRLSESLLKLITSTEKARYEAAAAKQTAPIVVNADTAIQVPRDPSADLREALRPAKPGETRLQGVLVRIECEPKGGIVFVVKTAGGLLRLRTPNFNNLEIRTWDAEVSGEITCGDRKPQNGVVVCYLPNTDKRVKFDGVLKSIEFVPSDFKLKPPA